MTRFRVGLFVMAALLTAGDAMTPSGERQSPEIAGVTDAGWENTIALPAGMSVARLPADIDLVTPVGHYTARYRRENGRIVVWRDLVIAREVVAPDAYPDFERLLHAALLDARAVIVLTNSEP